ncbi:MAG: hypothetical protein VB089_09625, partial [Anaerolineaceae bacterium]|nr:hypothetical protein [Anaerolineaceae bacterium]
MKRTLWVSGVFMSRGLSIDNCIPRNPSAVKTFHVFLLIGVLAILLAMPTMVVHAAGAGDTPDVPETSLEPVPEDPIQPPQESPEINPDQDEDPALESSPATTETTQPSNEEDTPSGDDLDESGAGEETGEETADQPAETDPDEMAPDESAPAGDEGVDEDTGAGQPAEEPAPAIDTIQTQLDLPDSTGIGDEPMDEPSTSGDIEDAPDGARNQLDPYFTKVSDGITYYFLPDCSGVSDPDVCTESPTPIQAAIDASKGMSIVDNTIYIQGSGNVFTEDIVIDGFDSDLTLEGGVGGGTTTLTGSITISNNGSSSTRTITLRNFVFNGNTITASCVSCTTAGLALILEGVFDGATVDVTGTDNDDVVTVTIQGGTGSNAITFDGNGGEDTLTLGGSSGDDAFTITDVQAVLQNTATTEISYSELEHLSLMGLDGNDTFNILSSGVTSVSVDGGEGLNDEATILGAITSLQNVEKLSLSDFFQVEGNFTVETQSQQVTLDTGETPLVNILTIGGYGASAFVGLNAGTPGAIGWNLTGVEFALAILRDAVNAARQWLSLQASGSFLSFVGIAGWSLAVDGLAVKINQAASDDSVVNYSATDLTVNTGAGHSLTFDMPGEELLEASGYLSTTVSDFVSLTGNVAFHLAGSSIVGIGTAVSALLSAGPASLSLTDADFGLQVDATGTAFELKNGTFSAVITGLSSITADSVLVQYTSSGVSVAANTVLAIGSLTYTFINEIAANTVAFAVNNFAASVADFVSLSGDLAFKLAGASIVGVGSAVSAILAAGGASLSLTDADFGLQVDASGTAFELKNGTFAAVITGLSSITADSVLVQYTSAGVSIAANTVLTIGSLTYTFVNEIMANTIAFAVQGFEATVSDFVTLSGDLAFKMVGSAIVAVGDAVSAILSTGPASLSLTDADFGLQVDASGTAFELKNGTFAAVIAGLSSITADSVLVQYTSASAAIAENTVLTVGSLSYT